VNTSSTASASAVAAVGQQIWVTDYLAGVVWRLDAATRAEVERVVCAAGYRTCVVDPAGYRRGSLNTVPLAMIGPA